MLFNAIKQSGLYDNINEIRCGVLNNESQLIPSDIFYDPKIKIIYIGHSSEYERPTLLHMRHHSTIDVHDTKYLYIHTKGLRWFGTDKEDNVVDWIKLLIYWNIEKWQNAILKLDNYDTYGCNYYPSNEFNPSHYSGNFFWVKNQYLQCLDVTIGPGYNDPEFWLFTKDPNFYNSYSSGLEGMGHYNEPFPETNYIYTSEDISSLEN
jgi:hypothetical protein